MNGGGIIALAITPSEDLLGLLTADKRLLMYNLGAVDAINVGTLSGSVLLQLTAWKTTCIFAMRGGQSCPAHGPQCTADIRRRR